MNPNLERIIHDLDALARFTEPDTPGWTRRFPSAAYLRGRGWLRQRMEHAGLKTWIDAAGNLFGRRDGLEELPPILAGSHSDTVLGGGRFDGTLGVVGAIEAARVLQEAGMQLRHPLVVADFLGEEANAFGVSCAGSRGMVAGLAPEWLARTAEGMTLAEAIRACGGQPEWLGAPLAQPGDFAACLELHIEQGPALEARCAALAAVTGIVGIRRGIFELTGQPDHAGTVPMGLRHDALAAASELVLAIERACHTTPGTVGTVGRLEVHPNQGNVVPGRVTLAAEVRSLDIEQIERVWRDALATGEAACEARGVSLHLVAQTDAAPCAPPAWLHAAVLHVCRELNPEALTLPSGAGHDTMHLAEIAPAAMIFVPSIGGRSHCPEELTAPEHLGLGVAALTRSILVIDRI